MLLDPTPAFRLLARRRAKVLAAMDPLQAQTSELEQILATASRTAFGRAHNLAALRSVRDYQRAVPLRTWDQLWQEFWQPAFPVLDNVTWPGRIGFFAETSGTTGARAKHIPVSRQMVRANRRAALDVLFGHLRSHPGSTLFGGPNLVLGGSSRLTRLEGGARTGDLSGIAAATMPAWTRGRALPPRPIALLGDWDQKLDRIASDIVGRSDLRSIAGTPSWILLLVERLLARSDTTDLATLFPALELVVHGGVGFALYRDRFAQLLGGRVSTAEVYPASEGFVALADEATNRDDPSLRLMLDNGLFFEFVPPSELDSPNPARHWIGNAELGRDYALVLTTNAGLFAYVLGDVVRLTSRNPARLIVTGRTAQMLSAFGEHLSVGELDRAIEAAAREAGVTVSDYTVSAILPDAKDARGGHLFVVECEPAAPADAGRFAGTLDRTLAAGNDDYAAHRAGLRPPALRFVPSGRFAGWMRARGKHGGQNKVPRVLADEHLLSMLLDEGSDR